MLRKTVFIIATGIAMVGVIVIKAKRVFDAESNLDHIYVRCWSCNQRHAIPRWAFRTIDDDDPILDDITCYNCGDRLSVEFPL